MSSQRVSSGLQEAFHLWSVSECNVSHRATLFSPVLFISIGDKGWDSRDGAEHSITLLTNMSELDSKDTINQRAWPGVTGQLIQPLMDIRHYNNLWRLCDCGYTLFLSETGCTCCVCSQTKGTSTVSTCSMIPAAWAAKDTHGIYLWLNQFWNTQNPAS